MCNLVVCVPIFDISRITFLADAVRRKPDIPNPIELLHVVVVRIVIEGLRDQDSLFDWPVVDHRSRILYGCDT
jgi:hypothetical protein